ncbi:hypothetical protein K488DRAFT_11800, partial [Vararia minispora EC-137]
AMAWLQKAEESNDPDTVAAVEFCRDHLESIPWDAPVPGTSRSVQLRTHRLAAFLSDAWLDDEMLNAGSEAVMCELSRPSENGSPHHIVRITNSHFLTILRRFRLQFPQERFTARPSESLDREIQEDSINVLEVVVHSHQSHWAGISLDLRSFTYFYRDGYYRHDVAQAQDIADLLWYLRSLNPSRFDSVEFTPAPSFHPSPSQTDTFSCGINLLSTFLEHHGNSGGWRQERSARSRMEMFFHVS